MKQNIRHIIALLISLLIFALTSCALFIPNDSFDGGILLDDEKISQIKSEIFKTESSSSLNETDSTKLNDSSEATIIAETHREKESHTETYIFSVAESTTEIESSSKIENMPADELPPKDSTTDLTETNESIETEIKETTEFANSQFENETILTESGSIIIENEEYTDLIIEVDTSSNMTNAVSTEQIETESIEKVYWVTNGKVWHLFKDCGYLKNSNPILSGNVEEAVSEGKETVCSSCSKKQEYYTETETEIITTIDIVFWCKNSKIWHLFEDCGYLKNSDAVSSGSIEDAMSYGKEKVCSSCEKRLKN